MCNAHSMRTARHGTARHNTAQHGTRACVRRKYQIPNTEQRDVYLSRIVSVSYFLILGNLCTWSFSSQSTFTICILVHIHDAAFLWQAGHNCRRMEAMLFCSRSASQYQWRSRCSHCWCFTFTCCCLLRPPLNSMGTKRRYALYIRFDVRTS